MTFDFPWYWKLALRILRYRKESAEKAMTWIYEQKCRCVICRVNKREPRGI
jgi:hypothetical protein